MNPLHIARGRLARHIRELGLPAPLITRLLGLCRRCKNHEALRRIYALAEDLAARNRPTPPTRAEVQRAFSAAMAQAETHIASREAARAEAELERLFSPS